MCDDLIHQGRADPAGLSRRAFCIAAAAGAATANAEPSTTAPTATDILVKTPDGNADAVLLHPAGQGAWPAVLMWPDILGLRPVFRDMGSRLAAQGYVVLVPNPFYRTRHAPIVQGAFDFNDPAARAALFANRAAMSNDGIARDATAYLACLDAQPATSKAVKAGVQGYCMGGELAFRTAAAVPGRVAAVASFHGGNGLATGKPDSPDQLIAHTSATFLVCQARNDDAKQPQVKDRLHAAFAAAHRPATVAVYPADHGWCVPGSQTYDATQAERAWTALTALYRKTLVA